jgi:trans-aconitate methyltransferase
MIRVGLLGKRWPDRALTIQDCSSGMLTNARATSPMAASSQSFPMTARRDRRL